MRILFITPGLPYPPNRGDKLKVFHLLKNLSRRHSITLLTFAVDKEDLTNIRNLKEFCEDIYTVPHSLKKSLISCLAGMGGSNPFQVEWFASRAMERMVASILSRNTFDVVHTHMIRMAQFTQTLSCYPRVLDLTDAKSLYLGRFLGNERNLLKRLALKTELARMYRYESILTSFECSLVCSEVDRKVLNESCPGARVELLENGVDLDYFKPDDSVSREPHTIICTGNMSYFPNEDGVRYFADQIFPLIQKEIPDARFMIVGQRPSARIRAMAGPNIVVTGAVDDIRPYYYRSSVAVSPIRFGSGTLNKVIEPMAMGIPVVASSVGTEGLPIEPDEHFLLASTPEHFAAQTVRLLKDRALASGMALKAQERIRGRLGWEAITARLEGFYDEVVRQHVMCS